MGLFAPYAPPHPPPRLTNVGIPGRLTSSSTGKVDSSKICGGIDPAGLVPGQKVEIRTLELFPTGISQFAPLAVKGTGLLALHAKTTHHERRWSFSAAIGLLSSSKLLILEDRRTMHKGETSVCSCHCGGAWRMLDSSRYYPIFGACFCVLASVEIDAETEVGWLQAARSWAQAKEFIDVGCS